MWLLLNHACDLVYGLAFLVVLAGIDTITLVLKLQGQTPLFPRIFGHEAGAYESEPLVIACWTWIMLLFILVVMNWGD
jgi:hypothetical protein